MSWQSEGLAAEGLQERVREERNPKWREWYARHLKSLGLDGPVKLNLREIRDRSLRRQGFEPRKQRRRVF